MRFFLVLMLSISTLLSAFEVSGNIKAPEEWYIFPDISSELSKETLSAIPDSIIREGLAVKGQKIKIKDNKFDLKNIFGKVQLNNTAYVFLSIKSDKKQKASIGIGADWWFQAWLNGEEILNTLESGNLDWPPHITNFVANVPFNKGENILAVKFISGTGSSLLTIGASEELRKIPKSRWMQMNSEAESRVTYIPIINDVQAEEIELTGIKIVLADDAKVSEMTAAKELSTYLQKATGKESPIIKEKQHKENDKAIFVGNTLFAKKQGLDSNSFSAEEWLIRTIGNKLILTGGQPRGSLYAVYHFLEDIVGVRWWSPWEEFVPELPAKFTCKILDYSGKPSIAMRSLDTYCLYHTREGKEKLWAPRNRINTEMHASIPVEYGGSLDYGSPSFVHTEGWYYRKLNEKGLLKKEWVAKRNGKREIQQSGKALEIYQLCFSNLDLRKALTVIFLENIEENLKKKNPPTIFDFSFNDTSSRCECEDCNKLAEKYGGTDTGLMLEFLNELAEEVKEKYPHVLLSTLAYMNTEPIPEGIKPHEKIIITLCDTVSTYTSPLSTENKFVQLLEKWSNISEKVKIWDYHSCFADLALPMPFESTFQPDVQLFKKHKVFGVMTELHQPIFEDMRDLRFWLLAKFYENPYLDQNKLIVDFTDGFYGPAAVHIRKYLQALQKAAIAKPGNFTTMATLERCEYLSPEFALEAQKYFNDAENAIKNSELFSKRVRHARLGTDKITYILYHKINTFLQEKGEKPDFSREEIAARIKQTVAEQVKLRADKLTWQGQSRADGAQTRFFRQFMDTEIQLDNCDDPERMTWAQPAWRPRSFQKEAIGELKLNTEHKVEGIGSINWTVQYKDVEAKLQESPKMKYVRLNYLYGADFARFQSIKFQIKCESTKHPKVFATMISPSGRYKHIPILEKNEVTNGWKEIHWDFAEEAGQACTHIYLSLYSRPNEFLPGDKLDILIDDIKAYR